MGKFARLMATSEVSITDEGIYGLEGSADSLACFGGGGGKGGSAAPAPIYTPPPVAPAAPAQAATMTGADAVQQEESGDPEEEAKKIKEAQKKGAKSLQIPLSKDSETASSTVGTI